MYLILYVNLHQGQPKAIKFPSLLGPKKGRSHCGFNVVSSLVLQESDS